MAELDYQAIRMSSGDFTRILASQGVKFLLSGEGKVPLTSLDHERRVWLFFSANWCRPCKSFIPELVQLYNNTLRTRGNKELEIVFISSDHNEDGFIDHFKTMPWLAVPFNSNLHKTLRETFQVVRIPTLVPLDSDGDGQPIAEDLIGLIQDYGQDAFPFTRKRKEELNAIDDSKRQGGKLEQLLGQNHLVSKDGGKILVSELVGKTIGLYFGAHWCPPCRAFTAHLVQVYKQLSISKGGCFEVILVSTDRDQKEFDVNISDMPWLALPFEERTRQDLCRIFKIKAIPELVLIGPDGKTISTNGKSIISLYGAKGFPFTQSRITEVETSLKKEGDALPQQIHDKKHQHVLKLDMAKAYVCDYCKRQGRFWAFSCHKKKEMWTARSGSGYGERREGTNNTNGLVAVAIDKDKNSQNALKWTSDHLLQKGQTVILIHVKIKPFSSHSSSPIPTPRLNQISDINGDLPLVCKDPDPQTRELFLPFRCFCTRKDINCKDVVLEETDVAKALVEYVTQAAIEILVVGASTKTGFLRFKATDIPGMVSKSAPDFCSVYVISKGKISTMRSASRAAPAISPLRNHLLNQPNLKPTPPPPESHILPANSLRVEKPRVHEAPRKSSDSMESFRSPFTRRGVNGKSYPDLPMPDTDISFVSSGRPSIDRIFPAFYDYQETNRTAQRLSNVSDVESNASFESMLLGRKSLDINSPPNFSSTSQDSDRLSTSSSTMDDVEAEMRRLKLELKQTMEMYSTACKEALTAKQKARELQLWKLEEERRMEEARLAEEAALAIAEKEKAKSKAAIEAAEAAQRIAQLEAQKRVSAEMKALKESEEKRKALDALAHSDFRYRKYTIEEIEAATEFFSQHLKIGEGGYGPVYNGRLDHTPVAIKVLRPDAAQGRSQFQQEVEVLSCIRHPNMVLLLGACPEYGCLVYEFMSNGSLDDRLFRRGNTPPLSWQLRFRIAAEIGTGLLFLHQTKPEPIVHRDLKPANILLDRNFVSKISDVGLARLVPPSVADNVTQYRMTSTAGTFCYIDPEYQQTGMLGIKSDIYSLGIMLLQIITAKPPMGLTHHVERAIEKGMFPQMLDQSIPDWPVEEALIFANIALKCAELRRKDRPDLGKVVLPELNRLRTLAEETMHPTLLNGSPVHSPNYSQVSLQLVSS
ncbi:hypothetical protein CCACVL1_23149 [Corchorus capsularis]|uniref:RING-type E3 ubiquitin transferase n=1 Tax=Corchorus capsularis TaxID=210143 RepID=A0A1R3GV25_COCAP|nr:hypothetical protein CCACVL1_23149 [Corchorus capsularis]